MLCAKSNRIGGLTALAVFSALVAFSGTNAARAQEPPTTIPAGGPLPYDPDALSFYGWLLYPSVNFLAENSNNYFMSQPKLSGWTLGVSPTVTAEWSSGIHTTTLFGTFQNLQYPPDNQVPQDSRIVAVSDEETWTQQYAPTRDLKFTFVGDYNHQTISPGLTSSIPNQPGFTGTIVLPNGNIQLPNGTIISPTGQVVGQAGATPTSSPFSTVNPYDVFTGSASVQKIFSDGILNLGASFGRQEYERQGTPDFNTKTFSESGSFWLGSVFYAYSNGSFTIRNTDDAPDSTTYQITGGIGTRQVGLFRASLYFGHQGSGSPSAGSAGGNMYGGSLTYYPTPDWTITINANDTLNLAPGNAAPSTQALNVSALTPLQVALSSSTQITSTTLSSSYTISPLWTATGTFGFTHIENIGSPIWDDSYVADFSLKYLMLRNLTLTWEYQFSSIVSNQPLTSLNRNLVIMSATYRF